MNGLLQSLASFVVALGILVTIHEFGHFWVARRLGIKILRFSVGFGRPLWGRRFGSDSTEFVVAAIPLGGYVKMLDEREGEVPAQEVDRAFNRQSLATRTAVVTAGPLFNFLFAILAYWLMFVIGISGLKPIIDEVAPDSIADRAGLEAGYQILAVDQRSTPTWGAAVQGIVGKIVAGEPVVLTVRDNAQSEHELVIDLQSVGVDDVTGGNLLQRLGITPFRPELPPVIGKIIPGSAAQRAGLEPHDRIMAADGQGIESWSEWVKYVQARPNETIRTEVMRAEHLVTVELRPEPFGEGDKVIGRIGAVVYQPEDADPSYLSVEKYSPPVALAKALSKTWEVSVLTLKLLGKMLMGQASFENLSGPISIAQYAGQSASIGIVAFVGFLAIVSVSLGVLNLLPIPILDGGHLLYYFIELISRRPVSETVQLIGQQVGIIILVVLMIVAFYNDIVRIFS